MSSRDHRRADPEVSYEGMVDLGSVPPPAVERPDVYRSQTAVTSMTDTLKDEIRRAKQEAKLRETEKTRLVPKFEMPEDAVPAFTHEAPTRPGKEAVLEKSGAIRRTDLPAVMVTEPERPEVSIEVTEAPVLRSVEALSTPLARPAPLSFADTIPVVMPTMTLAPAPLPRRAIWPRVLVLVLGLAATLVTAFALHRYRGSHRR